MNKEIEKLSEESTETREFTEDEINVYGLCDTHAKTACAVDCHDGEYSCAVTPQVRQTGNRLSGPAGTAYASLLT